MRTKIINHRIVDHTIRQLLHDRMRNRKLLLLRRRIICFAWQIWDVVQLCDVERRRQRGNCAQLNSSKKNRLMKKSIMTNWKKFHEKNNDDETTQICDCWIEMNERQRTNETKTEKRRWIWTNWTRRRWTWRQKQQLHEKIRLFCLIKQKTLKKSRNFITWLKLSKRCQNFLRRKRWRLLENAKIDIQMMTKLNYITIKNSYSRSQSDDEH